MLSAIFLARVLDAGEFASYAYFQLTLSMIATYGTLGLATSATKFFAEIKGDGFSKPPIMALSVVAIAVSVLAGLLVLILPASVITANFQISTNLMAGGVISTSLVIISSAALVGLERLKEMALIALFSGAIMLVSTIEATKESSTSIAMLGIVLATASQAVLQILVVIRILSGQEFFQKNSFNRFHFKQVLGQAGPMLMVTLLASSGTWVVGRLILNDAGPHEFAAYAIGLQWFSIALILPGMISRVTLPRIIHANKSSAGDTRRSVVIEAAKLTISASLFIAILGILCSRSLMAFYGGEFEDFAWMLAAFMVATVIAAPINTVANALIAADRQVAWLYMTAGWFVVLAGFAFLFSSHGALAGAMSQCIAFLVLGCLLWCYILKTNPIR